MASLGWVRVSATAAEACIAVSLVLVALDVGRPLRDAPWKTAGLAFAFGLVHGLGYLNGPEQRLIIGDGSLPQLRLESFTFQILHYEVFNIFMPAHIVNRPDVRVI